jgi:LPXTG cell wall anchor motif
MPHLLSSPRCSGTRMLRWATVVIPTAVVFAGSFGTTGAYAAPGGSAASHTASAAADHGNGGVGQANGAGNVKHAAAASMTASSVTTSPAGTSTAASHVTSGTAGTSGDPTQPQPLSNADRNPGGANNGGNCGSYCSTRDGSPSGNGNGGGKATGKPCAGCVGNADDKNPKGQYPNGSDHNAGYECDRNHGIGRSNPAHTGCTTPTTGGGGGSDCTTNPTAPGCTQGGGSDCTTNPTAPGCTQGGGGGGNACVPSPANHFCSSVLGEKQTTPPGAKVPNAKVPNAKVLSESLTRRPAGTTTSLPLTGADVALLISAGLAALVGGSVVLVAAARRRRC